MKISHSIFCLIAIWTVGLLFWTSQSVQKAEKELRQLKQVNHSEVEMVRVLSSEWDFLNRPERLEQLAKQYLTVDHIGTNNMVTSVDLVEKTAPVDVVQKENPNIKKVSVQNKSILKPIAELVEVEEKSETHNIIQKHDQENFQSLMDTLSKEEN